MFECTECYKRFTRNDSLLRHMRTKHKDFSIHADKNNMDQSTKHTTSQSSSNFFDKDVSSDLDNLSRQDDNSMSGYGDNNDDDNSGYSVTKKDAESKSTKFEGISNTFNQRIPTASQAIQSKFDSLKRQYGAHEFENESEKKNDMEIFFNNNAEMTSAPKLTRLLQTALDILMIKELQKSNRKHDSGSLESMEGNVQIKNSTEEEELENVPIKRFKYTKSENEDYSNNQSANTIRKYWHNPNTLVNELRRLETTTDIGQEIFAIIRRLNENNIKTNRFFEYIEHEKERDELIKNLNELKRTVIGREISSIINELQKAEIIEPIPGKITILTSDGESENDNDDDDNDDDENDNTERLISNEDYVTENQEESDSDKTENIAEKITMGDGLYIRPYKRF